MSAIIEFHFGQAEYSQSCECLRSCLGTEHSMMKFNTLFECGPSHPISTSHPSDVIHMISVPRPSLIRLNTKMKNNYNKKFSLSNSVTIQMTIAGFTVIEIEKADTCLFVRAQ